MKFISLVVVALFASCSFHHIQFANHPVLYGMEKPTVVSGTCPGFTSRSFHTEHDHRMDHLSGITVYTQP